MGTNHCGPGNSYMSAFYPRGVKRRLKGSIPDHSGEDAFWDIRIGFGCSARKTPITGSQIRIIVSTLVHLESLSNHIFLEHKSPTFISRHCIEEHNPGLCSSQSWAFLNLLFLNLTHVQKFWLQLLKG